MRDLFRRLGVDFDQWRSLVRAAIRVDLRTSSMAAGRRRGAGRPGRFLATQIIFYAGTGVLITVLTWPIPDVFLTGLIMVSYVMFMVGTIALLEHNAMILSPDDYPILGFRPVTSRTYFAARLANVIVYTTAISALFSLVPVLGLFLRWGPGVGVAGIAAVFGAAILTSLVMITVYATLLRRLGLKRLQTALSTLQLFMSVLVYGGYFFMAEVANADSRAAFHLDKTRALLAAPPAWFASYLDLAAGHRTSMETVPALVSLLALGLTIASLGGRLSLEYAERLGELTTARGSARPRARRRGFRLPIFTRGEGRVVALLIGSQFRNDLKFRMGVLAILPLTLIYLVIGIRQWGGSDPFGSGEITSSLSTITVAMFMFPMLLKVNMTRSDAYRASWIFFAAPSDHARIVSSAVDVLTVMFLGPYLLLVGTVLILFTGNVSHVLLYLLVVGMVSHLLLQIETLVEPDLPFSKPAQRGSAASRFILVMIAVGAAAGLMPILTQLIFRESIAAVLAVLVLLSAIWGVGRWVGLRVRRLAAAMEIQE